MTVTQALYRTYRPQTFKDVREQDHIVTVLEGAIKKQAIPHALLFSGPRGTGKTTLARIFAREIGTSDLDLYEIDAASNRGIDDIRELREAVHTAPYESPYKVYIIDEVHMLTKGAFNALLKTLEEPPAHVVFILATTEEDKLLDTIISRCQVFRLRAPSREVLATLLKDVATKEKYKLDRDGAHLIATAADGSFRDALGMLQKVMLGAPNTTLATDLIAAVIGAPKTALLVELIEALHTKDVSRGLAALESAHKENVNLALLAHLLLERLRAVMLLRHRPQSADTLAAAFQEAEITAITTIAADTKSPINSQSLLRLLQATEALRYTEVPLLPLELAVIDICQK